MKQQTVSKMERVQTAVEWLDRWFRDNPEATHEEGNKALEQAKQMEKRQIIESYQQGCFDDGPNFSNAEQYYKETYGGESDFDKIQKEFTI